MDKNNFDFDKTFDDLFKKAKTQFKDIDEHFIKFVFMVIFTLIYQVKILKIKIMKII
jgi:hypothetical protein